MTETETEQGPKPTVTESTEPAGTSEGTDDSPTPATPTPTPTTESSTPQDVYYENCDEARAAGAAPLYAGDPGYSLDLDRDGDGVACEPYAGP
ncbi:excalibur calcium-binding domain-containing protein [Streptomyces sp. NPDC020607]|uniref:excalibur calcium-binding domain-containing protein n=1 Tax=Streptomyces sp. NPDC020607 TaxID=3365082 RepID=UPI0037B725EB